VARRGIPTLCQWTGLYFVFWYCTLYFIWIWGA